MSDSTTQPTPQEPQEGVPAPSDTPPAETPPLGQDTPPAPSEKPPEEDQQAKRIARMTARMAAMGRERDEMAHRLAALEAHARATAPPPAPVDPAIQAQIDHAATQKAEADRRAEKTRDFHQQGSAAFADWDQRMADLQRMGAIPISTMFLEIPNGHKVAAQLRDNPEALEEILAEPTERARAMALGKYVQQIEASPTRQVSKVPPPPKPMQTRSASVFNEYQATTDQLLQHYSKQAMEARGNVSRR